MLAGLLFWFFQDLYYGLRLREMMEDLLFQELRQDVQMDWLRLDERLHMQVNTNRWLVERKEFVDHVERLEGLGWMQRPAPSVMSFRDPPIWLPKRQIMGEHDYAVHALLVDGMGQPRELYEAPGKTLPLEVLEGVRGECRDADDYSTVRYHDASAFFISCAVLSWSEGRNRAVLFLFTPLDDDFLLVFDTLRQDEGLIVFLDERGERVIASSRPELVVPGTPFQRVEEGYLVLTKVIANDLLSAIGLIRYVSLLPKSRLDELVLFFVAEGRNLLVSGHVLMIAMFVLIIYWMGRHMESLTRRMVRFASSRLNLQLSAAAPGNAWRQLVEQFEILITEIETARAREVDSLQKLAMSNRALESSLTMLKRTQSQLLTSEKMAALGGLVAGVAHEINTPVGIGVTAASFLENRTQSCQTRYQDGTLTRADLEGYFQDARESSVMILANLTRAADLVRSFKQVAVDTSSEASRLFDFHTVIQQILQSLHPRLKKMSHRVVVSCPEGLVYFGRPDIFSQIITNFVLNSLLHGLEDHRPGEMKIDLYAEGERIVLRYADNGRGMGDEELARIFEPFFTTARHKGGSGLGMHIVFNLVTATLDGTIHCESTPGQGTVFVIEFPARRQQV
ncbi:MAG: HAMP domain-containing histidine kinase [Magnetococcales bacterium]|nr:HAMP domain-containing histidine kinase [Magnetococcales bacterium]